MQAEFTSRLASASIFNTYLEKWMESFPSLPLVKANRCGACVVKAHMGPEQAAALFQALLPPPGQLIKTDDQVMIKNLRIT
eukprot:1593769-Amphidinium_carterae.2